MRLRQKVKAVHEWDHVNHYVTLGLVAVAELATLLEARLSRTFINERFSEQSLHFLHLTEGGAERVLHSLHLAALGIVFLDITLYLLFARNIGKEISHALGRNAKSKRDWREKRVALARGPYKYQALPVSPEDIEFVTSSTGQQATLLCEINYEAFQGSAFEMNLEDIQKRNAALIEKNSRALMLVKNPLRETAEGNSDDYIGFSCVLPLNEAGTDLYLNGILKDKDMRASLVCQSSETCKTILIFTIALAKKYRKTEGLAAEYYPFLLRCTQHHVETIALAQGDAQETLLWAQVELPQLGEHFKHRGFECQEDKRSGDGFELYKRKFDPGGDVAIGESTNSNA